MGRELDKEGVAIDPKKLHAERAQAVPAEEVGSGEDIFLVGTEQEDEQRLREAAGERGSLHLRGDEPPDGEAIGSLMRLFRQFQREVRRINLTTFAR